MVGIHGVWYDKAFDQFTKSHKAMHEFYQQKDRSTHKHDVSQLIGFAAILWKDQEVYEAPLLNEM